MPHPTWYDANAKAACERYESVSSARVHAWLTDLLPAKPATILDVGAGSGRDAAWLAAQGYDVVAVEPSSAMRALAQARHADRPIQWLADALPGLDRTFRTGLSFDLILLSAVWMHVPSSDRRRAFRKLVTLLKPGGVLALTLRNGPAGPERGFHPVSVDEIRTLARNHGAFVEREGASDDVQGRKDVQWTQLAIRLPDDGTGALPLLRHVILLDSKSSTYKLALLRTLCRIADGAGGMARLEKDDHVSIPMGLVALTWLRLYKPLLEENLPQNPRNRRGAAYLGFAKEAFQDLASVSHHDLRVGARFPPATGTALHNALRCAAITVIDMPGRYITYPGSKSPVLLLPVRGAVTRRRPKDVRLDEAYLSSFGRMRVPAHLWNAIQRFAAWIEPAIVSEWKRETHKYAQKQGRFIQESELATAMTWSDPARGVSVPRERAEKLLATRKLHCVWSGKRLSPASLDIDHCFPWAVWPCGDLWNLLPAHRRVNQHQKRDRLPSDLLMRAAQERIIDWWTAAYREQPDRPLAERFALEASVSLPGVARADSDLDSYYSALNLQRLRLRQTQQVPEWTPKPLLVSAAR